MLEYNESVASTIQEVRSLFRLYRHYALATHHRSFKPAIPDSKYQGLSNDWYHNSTFVNDTDLLSTFVFGAIRGPIDNSVRALAACAIFGECPSDDQRPLFLSEKRLLESCSYFIYVVTGLLVHWHPPPDGDGRFWPLKNAED